MADLESEGVSKKAVFCSELLCPTELFSARSRSHKIPARGQKDFLPDASEKQKERLRRSLDEHWALIEEERVERLGSLVKTEWIPTGNVVELKSPAGKFWQTMGFSEQGKQFLLPEEALHLLECGNVQVFYRDLPLSVQEGYEMFLSSDTITLQQYQVFSHLKRLGYIVNRFDPSSVPSPYERQLNLSFQREKPARQHLKRKRSHGPSSSPIFSRPGKSFKHCGLTLSLCFSRIGDGQEEQQEKQKKEDSVFDRKNGQDPGRTVLGSEEKLMPDPPAPAVEIQMEAESVSAAPQRSWWVSHPDEPPCPPEGTEDRLGSSSHLPRPKWDFSKISFPDLGSSGWLPSLPAPNPALLPPGLSAGTCDITPWLGRLNLKPERLSQREREQERVRCHRRGVNEDREVQRCSSWKEYRELLERRRQGRTKGRPAHLWEEAVRPLTAPGDASCTGDLLERIGIIKPSRLCDGASNLSDKSDQWKIAFDVYQPGTVAEFKKTNPGKPYSRIFDGPVPDLQVLKRLAHESGDIPVMFAVVDSGDISFFTFKDFQLPTDVWH
ncbi:tRNA-splicing endonuclease subunit Sen54 isoform X2 [Lepisosteus oculatus]|uniref:tRNA-splicing endonuclease subunit Sen54 isoform X2 n=1 Tax=Lepisosteus oculatus TaxID=7918 RepID=UPI0037228E95